MPRTSGTVGTIIERGRSTTPPPYVPWANPAVSPYNFLAFTPQWVWEAEKQGFSFEIDFIALNGGQTRLGFAPIRQDFLLTSLAAVVTDNQNPPNIVWPQTAGGPTSNILVQITAGKAKYDFFSQPAPLDNIVGSVQGGNIMPYFFAKGEVINCRLQSLWAVATFRNIRLTFAGAYIRP